MDTWLLPKGATSVDPNKPLGKMQRFAPVEKRCTNKDGHKNRCKWWFLASDPHKECPRCRRATKRARTSEKGKAAKRRYDTTEKGKESAKRAKTSEKGKASQKRAKTSEKGKARKKRENDTRTSQLSKSLLKMVRGVHRNPASFRELGLFEDNADAEAFFESTKTEPWMQDAQWGSRTKTTEPQTVLQIGHKIPKAWYRHDDEAEIRKCWSRANLFAQCAVENHEAADRNLLTREAWMALKAVWPKQCADMSDEAAWQWASRNVDNATRKAARAAAEAEAAAVAASTSGGAGPSDLNAVLEESSSDEEDDDEEEAANAPDAYASEPESEEESSDDDDDDDESDNE